MLILSVAGIAILVYVEKQCGPAPASPSQITVVHNNIPPGTDVKQLYLYCIMTPASMTGTTTDSPTAYFILNDNTDLHLKVGQLSGGWQVDIDQARNTRLTNNGQTFTFAYCPPDTRAVPALINRLVVPETQGPAYACLLAIGEPARPFYKQAGAGSPPVPAHNPGSSFLNMPTDIGGACQMMLSELDARRQAGTSNGQAL